MPLTRHYMNTSKNGSNRGLKLDLKILYSSLFQNRFPLNINLQHNLSTKKILCCQEVTKYETSSFMFWATFAGFSYFRRKHKILWQNPKHSQLLDIYKDKCKSCRKSRQTKVFLKTVKIFRTWDHVLSTKWRMSVVKS